MARATDSSRTDAAMTPGGIDPELVAAYERTRYDVYDPAGEFVLVPGAASSGLMRLYASYGVASAAFLTAWNPRSEPAGDAANTTAQTRLRMKLEACGCVVLEAFGADVSGKWPGEPSLLALGLIATDAMTLGRQFDQNAILFAGDDAIPQLVLLR